MRFPKTRLLWAELRPNGLQFLYGRQYNSTGGRGFGVLLLILTIFTVNLWAIVVLFALVAFSFVAFSTIANVLPSDLFTSESVASVSGMSGTGAGIGTIIASLLIGQVSDARRAAGTHSFDPIVIVAAIIPFVAMILVLLLVRNTRATEEGLVRRI